MPMSIGRSKAEVLKERETRADSESESDESAVTEVLLLVGWLEGRC
jgi:hypothetical protein